MRSREGQRALGVRPGTVAGDTALAPGRRTAGGHAIVAGVAGVALVFLAVVITSRGGSPLPDGHPRAVEPVQGAVAAEAPRMTLEMATRWVDGLAAGLILPSDVTSRLAAQDPDTAEVVTAAWSELRSVARPSRFERAVRWIDGLVAGLILPSDVTSRLAAQDPETAEVVTAAWSELRSLSDSTAFGVR